MTYIENIFVCIVAPLLVAMICMGKRYYRFFIFSIAGMGACILSAYINTFFARIYNADLFNITTEIAPVVEEIIKLLPLLFFLLIFEPKPKEIESAVLILATSFATFENICYLTQNGAAELPFLLIRGFGTGAMHVIGGAITGCGLVYIWKRGWLKIAGTAGLLCAAINFHAIYNLLIAHGSITQYIAYSTPIFVLIVGFMVRRLIRTKQFSSIKLEI
ncbi:MAG: PrsW family intramembrane metalloprotease [Clostridiales bacterium]|jgi:RsiW-degrading membrane proteinase PrsW (M82 family)|nr:PrsW family intramembrane metalloprotease [Clostridiales bacterium]